MATMPTSTRRAHADVWREAMTVTVPAGVSGNVEIRQFEVTERQAWFDEVRAAVGGHGRHTRTGTYTALYRNGHLWMSDTTDEQRDHMPVLWQASQEQAKRVLVNGLGLGMVVAALLAMDHVEHIDVVELDADVIALVGPHYLDAAADAGKTMTIHHADAYDIKWPTGVSWDVVWSDIWPDLCTDNLEGIARLRRKYGRRSGWHGCWARELLLRQRERENRQFRHWRWPSPVGTPT